MGPHRDATPHTPEMYPCMRARRSSPKSSPTTVMPSVMSDPAPNPCKTRKAMSCVMLWARPDSAEPKRNTVSPVRNIGRRP
jgi:hypothetical protein